MSQAKRQLEEIESNRNIATQALHHAGHITYCPVHDGDVDELNGDMDLNEPDFKAERELFRLGFDGTHREAVDLLEDVIGEIPENCPICASNFARD
jgi:hypothetical protein